MTRTLLSVVAVVFWLGIVGGVVPADARQSLVYGESSLLTEPITLGWTNVSKVGGQVVHVTEASRFVDQLWSAPWNRVVLVGHSTNDFTLASAALADFARSNPEATVVIILLDNRFVSVESYANIEVPIATSTWYRGVWATRYSRIISADPLDHQTQSGSGFSFPNFDGVEVLPPLVSPSGALASAGGSRGDTRGQAQTPCQQCQLDYENDLDECNTDRDDYVDMCDDVYGPDAQPPQTPNPTEYQGCITAANANHTNCVSAATSRLKLCRKLHQCDPQMPT